MPKRHLDEYSGGILPEVIVSPQPFVFTKDGSISSNYDFVSEDRGKLLMDYINNLISLNPKSKTKIVNRKKLEEGGRRSLKSGGTIYIKPENRGKFNATKERTGKTTEELTHSKNPLTRKRAIFAQNAAKWKH